MSGAKSTGKNARGSTLLYQLITMIVMSGMVSLAVDVGRVQAVKTELHAAADAGSMAAAGALLTMPSTATSAASSAAADNNADGWSITLQSSDVETGHWNIALKTFTANLMPINAARVTAVRNHARGTAVPTIFANVFGVISCDAQAASTAIAINNPSPHVFCADSSFTSQGLLTTSSYPTCGVGDVASNGNIRLNLLNIVGVTSIDGDCSPGSGCSIQKPALGVTNISGSTTPLGSALSFPTIDASDYATTNDNANLPCGSVNNSGDFTSVLGCTVPAGNYYVRNFTVLANVAMTISGQATFYVTGNTTIAGNVPLLANKPSNLKLFVVGSGAVTMTANLSIGMQLYAPQSALTMLAGVNYYGSFAVNTFNSLGLCALHYDTDDLVDQKQESVKLVK